MKGKERIIYIGLIVVGVSFFFFYDGCRDKREARLLNEIAKKDELKKEDDGRWSRLIPLLDTPKQLKEALKESFEGLSDELKKQLDWEGLKKELKWNNERMLEFQTFYTTFKPRNDTALIMTAEPRTGADWQFRLLYPDSINPFIEYNGLIFATTRRIAGDWKFNRLPFSVVLTEMPDKTWKSRLIAPEWVVLDSIKVNALPVDKIAPVNKFRLIGGIGGGYSFSNKQPVFSLMFGGKIKKMYFIGSGCTDGSMQLHVLREFR